MNNINNLAVIYDDKEKCRRIDCNEIYVDKDYYILITNDKQILLPKNRVYRIEKNNLDGNGKDIIQFIKKRENGNNEY